MSALERRLGTGEHRLALADVVLVLSNVVSVLANVVASLAAQQPVFRSSVDLVTVDVSVTSGKNAVRGLTSQNFELRDNGVVQQIEAVTVESMPVDVTLVLDVSDSVHGAMLKRLQTAVSDTATLLTDRDRLRLVTFSNVLREAFGFRSGGSAVTFSEVQGGATALYDGLVAAMLTVRPVDRRHLVMAFTDGVDSASFFNPSTARDVALQADAVVHVVIGLESPVISGGRFVLTPPPLSINRRPLDDITRATGGLVTMFNLSDSISGAFRQALNDFRTSYVLRYAANGVDRDGWHDVKVTVKKRGDYVVRARKGYSGS